MLNQLKQYIHENFLLQDKHKVLLAISGGIDSMVMLKLFSEMNTYSFAIAHCNFQLRGNESREDQEFVKEMAIQSKREFYTVNFDTLKYAKEKGLSIQMAARELRYNWFSKLAEEHQWDRIAVAHNKDDIIETMFINLVRGTGIKGLTGIKPQSGKTIRPLLFASRAEIENYAAKHKIKYREDSSNAEVKYKRNLIRHRILPLFKRLNPSISETLIQESEIFSETWNIYQQNIESLKKQIVTKKERRIMLNIAKLVELNVSPPLLFDMLSEYGFSYSVIKNIVNSLEGESGRKFYSTSHILLKNRDHLIIEVNDEVSSDQEYEIREDQSEVDFPVKFSIIKTQRDDNYSCPKTLSIASLDRDKLKFPLTLRHWKKGDYFYPLGLGGKKKLSDFFIDEKIDLLEKRNIWLLTSENEVVWIVGQRIDDRFKITAKTKTVLMLEIKD